MAMAARNNISTANNIVGAWTLMMMNITDDADADAGTDIDADIDADIDIDTDACVGDDAHDDDRHHD